MTEKATSVIDTYTVATTGLASGPTSTASNGSTPYGFAFSPNGNLVVSDAGPGALSSYSISSTGALTVVSGTVLDNQSAPCWVSFAEGGRYTYTTNAHSNSISTYQVARNGSLVLQASVGATTGAAPTDVAVTTGSQYFLSYDAGAGDRCVLPRDLRLADRGRQRLWPAGHGGGAGRVLSGGCAGGCP